MAAAKDDVADINASVAEKVNTRKRMGNLKKAMSAEREAVFTEEDKVRVVMRKAPKGGPLHPIDAQINRVIAMVRAKAMRSPSTLLR
jgi:hypothetical protein